MKVPDNDDNFNRCICGNCPTHDDCMKKEEKMMFYCSRDSSGCNVQKQGCICGECPVASDYRLNDLYFCVIGRA